MKKIILLGFLSVFLVACNQNSTVDISLEEVEKAFSEIKPRLVLEKKGIKIIEANDFPLFSDTKLSLITDTNTFQFGPNSLELKLKNYRLGGGTTDQEKKKVRLNETGQFLYFIKNNNVVRKKKELLIDFDLKRGTNTFFIAPARSYEMSVKNDNSWLAFELTINNTNERASYRKITEPSVIICSPSGLYKEGNSERILLDFFIINSSIAKEGNKVKVIIDNKVNFVLDTWSPFYIEGLKEGRHSVKIDLIDKEGNKIEGKYTSTGPVYFSLQSIKY